MMDDSKKKQEEHVDEAPHIEDEEMEELQNIEDHELDDLEERDSLANSASLQPGTDDVEFAQEAAVDNKTVREPMKSRERETDMDSDVHAGMGWVAVVLSVISFFIMPVLLGAAGIVVGFLAKRRGVDTLGNTAIVAGAISILLTLFFAPF